MADDNNPGAVPKARPTPLRVLPCIDSTVRSSYFAALRAVKEVELLPIALASTLAYCAQSEQPDAIVIATERFAASMWGSGNSLGEMLSGTPTVLLAAEVNPSLRRQAARFHIRSVLPMNVSTDQLLAAIHATVAGLAVTFEPDLPGNGAGWSAEDRRFTEELEPLTGREIEVLRLMARGHGNKEIAARLGISEHTAKFHVSSILGKLNAASRTEAVTIGIMRGLVAI